jgi:hypothetical protein
MQFHYEVLFIKASDWNHRNAFWVLTSEVRLGRAQEELQADGRARQGRPGLFDGNTNVALLPPSPLIQDRFEPAKLALILAFVPDGLPWAVKSTELGGTVVTPSTIASHCSSPVPQLVNLGEDQGEFR